MSHLTIVCKYNGKLYIGVINKEDSIITHFQRLFLNDKMFHDNIFYIMMITNDDKSEIYDTEQVNYNISTILEEEMLIVIANNILEKFKKSTVFH